MDLKIFTGLCFLKIFKSVFEAELSDNIPVIHTTIGGIRTVGRLTVGKFDYISCFKSNDYLQFSHSLFK